MGAGVVIILHQKNLHRYRFLDELPWASLKKAYMRRCSI